MELLGGPHDCLSQPGIHRRNQRGDSAGLQSDDPPEYVLLLNSDTIVEEHALGTLISFMDTHPRAGIAGSMLVAPDGTVESSPFRFPGIATELDRGLRLGFVSKLLSPWGVVLPKQDGPFRAGWVSGASLILRRTMLEQIGLLDEGLYTYFDDPDICLRGPCRLGNVVCAGEPDRPPGGCDDRAVPATGRRNRHPAYWHQARRRFFLKNYGAWYTALADAAFILGYAIWRLRRRLQRKPDTDPPHLLIDSIRHSVFCAGFRVPVVENPAMCNTTPSPAAVQP